MSTTQTANKAGRDIIGGNKIEQFAAPSTPLTRLYEIFRDANAAAPYTAQISDMLQHYCATTTGSDVRGLEEKLNASNRQDLLADASMWKEQASKMIMKWQTSPVAQDILTHILTRLHAEFTLNVRPAVEAGKTREEVDELISSKVLQPAHVMLGDNDLGLSYIDLLGLLFFLGGNCHIRWDKC
ncbi:ABC-three component system protein [Polaromonas sp.]|uniref:ABC-three component system protein n=1 Tax=Polaromonas sp. TaxID=1869339 RepID=UPI0034594F29